MINAVVVLAEDRNSTREGIESVLTANGHEVKSPSGHRTQDMIDGVDALINGLYSKNGRSVDLLILDIDFSDDRLGGLKVLEALSASQSLYLIREVVIVSKWADIRNENYDEVVKAMERHKIPSSNLLSKNVARAERILNFINKMQ
jgi:CheY-like chemotaxis protein